MKPNVGAWDCSRYRLTALTPQTRRARPPQMPGTYLCRFCHTLMYLLWFRFTLSSCINLEFICFVIWCQLIKNFEKRHINVLTPPPWKCDRDQILHCGLASLSAWVLGPHHMYCIPRNPLKVGFVCVPSVTFFLIIWSNLFLALSLKSNSEVSYSGLIGRTSLEHRPLWPGLTVSFLIWRWPLHTDRVNG